MGSFERLRVMGWVPGAALAVLLAGTAGVEVGDECSLKLAAGNNTVSLHDLGIGADLVIKTGGGDDSFDLTGTAVGGETKISDGGGNDTGP